MKKFLRNHSYTLSQVAAVAFASKKVFLISVFFFLTGISTGIFLELTMAADEKSSLAGYLQQYLYMDSGSVDYPNPFLSSLTSNLLLLLIIFLAGLSALGFPAALAALTYKGMALGFCTGLIVETLKDKGILVILTSLVPQNLILIPVFILASAAAVNYGLFSLRSRRMPTKKNLKDVSGSYILLMLFLCLAIGLACGLEAILYPIVL
ncbi:stage II sporulation protein M [Anaerovorax odorimutans]|uniref:Stage II sporulation protein M n=1 Tax=Anaerovorax odorimutans TaxID=109327 RepID=A0ABT1RJN0_9FIRM|nr:stage II sporulation protein M [Anaerovorax odorimutans]MCQ4635383.1 stage II sporulation protein M [Anaerovorax odorimutans]